MRQFGTVADVAELSGKSTNSVIRYADAGKIECLTTDKGHRLFTDPKESARQLEDAMTTAMRKKVDKIRETKENNNGTSNLSLINLINKRFDSITDKIDGLQWQIDQIFTEDKDEEQLELFDKTEDIVEDVISEELL